jgi:hypothetical protein
LIAASIDFIAGPAAVTLASAFWTLAGGWGVGGVGGGGVLGGGALTTFFSGSFFFSGFFSSFFSTFSSFFSSFFGSSFFFSSIHGNHQPP